MLIRIGVQFHNLPAAAPFALNNVPSINSTCSPCFLRRQELFFILFTSVSLLSNSTISRSFLVSKQNFGMIQILQQFD